MPPPTDIPARLQPTYQSVETVHSGSEGAEKAGAAGDRLSRQHAEAIGPSWLSVTSDGGCLHLFRQEIKQAWEAAVEPMMSAYGATKGALESLNQSWAVESAPFGIRVNAISPGTISSDDVMIMLGDATQGIISSTPMNRVGSPEEIAKVALFLAGDQSSFMTGALVKVDGGVTLR